MPHYSWAAFGLNLFREARLGKAAWLVSVSLFLVLSARGVVAEIQVAPKNTSQLIVLLNPTIVDNPWADDVVRIVRRQDAKDPLLATLGFPLNAARVLEGMTSPQTREALMKGQSRRGLLESYIVLYYRDADSANRALETMNKDPRVLSIEPNRALSLSAAVVPNDRYFQQSPSCEASRGCFVSEPSD